MSAWERPVLSLPQVIDPFLPKWPQVAPIYRHVSCQYWIHGLHAGAVLAGSRLHESWTRFHIPEVVFHGSAWWDTCVLASHPLRISLSSGVVGALPFLFGGQRGPKPGGGQVCWKICTSESRTEVISLLPIQSSANSVFYQFSLLSIQSSINSVFYQFSLLLIQSSINSVF